MTKPLLFLTTLALLLLEPRTVARAGEETLFLFENRKVTVTVPDGFGYATAKDDSGMMSVKIADPHDRVSLELRFLPDPDGRFATARARRELMNDLFADYVASSTEKAMRFEELEPRSGAGTYCIFTDANLMGKPKPPSGEFLHLTSGVKTWAGVVAVFRCFSQDPNSPEHQAVLRMLRESVEEKPVPLK